MIILIDWAQHGISGRAVLLDMVRFFTKDGKPLPYDPWASHAITVPEIEACAREQGVTFQKADILLLRVGFTKRYYESSQAEKDALVNKPETLSVNLVCWKTRRLSLLPTSQRGY